jgi:hypothetical protein
MLTEDEMQGERKIKKQDDLERMASSMPPLLHPSLPFVI